MRRHAPGRASLAARPDVLGDARSYLGDTMGEFDPVPWEVVEAAVGPPASVVVAQAERMREEVRGQTPYEAVKTVHDALYELDEDPSVPNLADPFIIAYILEKEGVVSADDDGDDDGNSDANADGNDGKTGRDAEYASLVERRPSDERLRELFWERERTLWWIGLLAGVHPTLVTYWFYEADIPLMERNFSESSMAEIRAVRRDED